MTGRTPKSLTDDEFLKQVAFAHDMSVERLMSSAKQYYETGEPAYANQDIGSISDKDWARFWSIWATRNGVLPPEIHNRDSFFSCSC